MIEGRIATSDELADELAAFLARVDEYVAEAALPRSVAMSIANGRGQCGYLLATLRGSRAKVAEIQASRAVKADKITEHEEMLMGIGRKAGWFKDGMTVHDLRAIQAANMERAKHGDIVPGRVSRPKAPV